MPHSESKSIAWDGEWYWLNGDSVKAVVDFPVQTAMIPKHVRPEMICIAWARGIETISQHRLSFVGTEPHLGVASIHLGRPFVTSIPFVFGPELRFRENSVKVCPLDLWRFLELDYLSGDSKCFGLPVGRRGFAVLALEAT
jgi:hypothetical protein